MKVTKTGVNSMMLAYYQEYFGKDKTGYLNVLIPAAVGLVMLALLAIPLSVVMKKFRKSKRSVLLILLIFDIAVIAANCFNIEKVNFKRFFEKSVYTDATRVMMSINLIASLNILIPSVEGPVIPFYLSQIFHILSSAGMFVVLYDMRLYSLILILLSARTVINTFLVISSLSSFCRAGPIYVNAYNLIIGLYTVLGFGEAGIAAWLIRQGYEKNATVIMFFFIVAATNFIMALKYQVWKPKIVVTTHERVVRKSPHKK